MLSFWREFQHGSQDRLIVPVLIATEARKDMPDTASLVWPLDGSVARVVRARPEDLNSIIAEAAAWARTAGCRPIDGESWNSSAYRPSWNILEVAAIVEAVIRAQAERRRVVWFVAGVLGAGKTLTGLSAVHDPEVRSIFTEGTQS